MNGQVTSFFAQARRYHEPRTLRANLAAVLHRGQRDAGAGVCHAGCPYPPETVENDLWRYGWRMVRDRLNLTHIDRADWIAADIRMLERLWTARITPSLIVRIMGKPRREILHHLHVLEGKSQKQEVAA